LFYKGGWGGRNKGGGVGGGGGLVCEMSLMVNRWVKLSLYFHLFLYLQQIGKQYLLIVGS